MKNTGVKKVFVGIAEFFGDLLILIVRFFQIALGAQKRRGIALKAHAFSSFVAGLLTCGVIAKLLNGSMIFTGIQYFVASVEKHLAIAWAAEGDWYHWMTRDRYLYFKAFKEDLIANDKFASFLSDLATKGFASKVLQVVLILLCVAAMLYLISVVYRCISHLVWAIRNIPNEKEMIKAEQEARARRRAAKERRHTAKVIDISDFRKNA